MKKVLFIIALAMSSFVPASYGQEAINQITMENLKFDVSILISSREEFVLNSTESSYVRHSFMSVGTREYGMIVNYSKTNGQWIDFDCYFYETEDICVAFRYLRKEHYGVDSVWAYKCTYDKPMPGYVEYSAEGFQEEFHETPPNNTTSVYVKVLNCFPERMLNDIHKLSYGHRQEKPWLQQTVKEEPKKELVEPDVCPTDSHF